MDRNTVIGFSLIFLILAGYYWYTAPSPEEQARMQEMRDSIALVEKRASDSLALVAQKETQNSSVAVSDTANETASKSQELAAFEKGTDSIIILKNKQLTLRFHTQGGSLNSVKLNEYKRSDKTDLELLVDGKNNMGWTWTDQKGQELNSRNFFWEVSECSDSVMAFRLSVNENQYIEQRYVINENKPYVVEIGRAHV